MSGPSLEADIFCFNTMFVIANVNTSLNHTYDCRKCSIIMVGINCSKTHQDKSFQFLKALNIVVLQGKYMYKVFTKSPIAWDTFT